MKMSELLSKIAVGLRTRGLKYPRQAFVNELRYPRHVVTPYVRGLLIRAGQVFNRRSTSGDGWSADSLHFVYDLRVAPLTYDFASYLAAAEIERRLRSLGTISVIFVTGEDSAIRDEQPDYEAVLDREARSFRFKNIVLPMLGLLPSIEGYAMCGSRQQADALLANCPASNLYPSDYRLFLPRQPSKRVIFDHAGSGVPVRPMYSASAKAHQYVREFLHREAAGRLPVVITLRNYGYMTARNSRNEDWVAFASGLDSRMFAPIFVHDTETIMAPPLADFGGYPSCDAASWNVEIRVALYEQAWLNLAVMHGPMELCWYLDKARYVLFINVGSAPQTVPARFEENGQTVGEDFSFFRPYQHIAWCEDSVVNIRNEFESMKKIIGPTQDGPVHRIETSKL
jgi:hypothetical protein